MEEEWSTVVAEELDYRHTVAELDKVEYDPSAAIVTVQGKHLDSTTIVVNLHIAANSNHFVVILASMQLLADRNEVELDSIATDNSLVAELVAILWLVD